jgi:hypothetical protein
MKTSDNNLALGKTIGRAFVGIGSVVAIAGLIWLSKTATFVSKASKASGTVIQMDSSRSSKGGTTYSPVFTFTDSSGIIHTQHSSIGSSSYTFEPGEKVTVLYDSAAPNNSEIDTFGQVWLGPLLVTGFGMAFGGFAYFWLYVVIRGTRAENTNDAA